MTSVDGKEGDVASPIPGLSDMNFNVPCLDESSRIRGSYDMEFKNLGSAVIINNKTFDSPLPHRTRIGTDVDRDAMYETFDILGFESIGVHHDKSKAELKRILQDAAGVDHTESSCFVAVILSFGENRTVLGKDGKAIDVDELVKPFKGNNCPSLTGKPKIFIVQACSDSGVFQTDSLGDLQTYGPDDQKLPEESNVFIAYCSTPGSLAWNGTNPPMGSWFIQATVEGLKKFREEKDLYWIMDQALRKVDHEYTKKTKVKQNKSHGFIEDKTTKRIFFKSK